jgi:hypothetical protein
MTPLSLRVGARHPGSKDFNAKHAKDAKKEDKNGCAAREAQNSSFALPSSRPSRLGV